MTIDPAARRSATTWALYLALLLVLILRLWRLNQAGPSDYDSVSNWQNVQTLAAGDWSVLFNHGAPGFIVLFAPLAWFTSDFSVFQLVHAVMAVASLAVLGGFVSRVGQLRAGATAAVVLLAGTSLLLTSSGRDFAENAVSLGLGIAVLSSYYERLHTRQVAALRRTALWLALGLCFSYKLLFLVPILLVLEWWAADGLLWRQGAWWQVALILAAPYLVFGAIGVWAGLPWYRWFGFYYRTVFPDEVNLSGNQQRLLFEPFFYPHYLLQFEPAMLLGLLLALWTWRGRQHWRRGQPLALGPYLLAWTSCLLLGLSLLAKAPRGLLFAYGPMAALLVLAGQRLLPSRALGAVVLAALAFNGYVLWRELYSLVPTHYPQVAAWLRAHHVGRIGTTVGIGLAPYHEVTLISNERQLASLRRQGYQYVLLDSYWRVAHVVQFDSLRRQRPIAAWPEPQQTARLLFLEHAEYTGLKYAEMLALQHAAAQDTLQLRLYRLGP